MPAQPDLGKQAKAETAGEIPHDAVLAALDSLVASAAFGKGRAAVPIPAGIWWKQLSAEKAIS